MNLRRKELAMVGVWALAVVAASGCKGSIVDEGDPSGGAMAGGTGGTGMGGTGGSTGGTSAAGDALGVACSADGDCPEGLICLTSDGTTLGTVGPPGGVCTVPCTDHADCHALTQGAYCIAFDEEGTLAFCMEGCFPGKAGVPKCQSRSDMGCSLVGLADSKVKCAGDDDCRSGEICNPDTRVCAATYTACTPTCAGDFDCPENRHCDFSSGMCADGEATGLPIGAVCDTSASTDPCSGFCIATGDTKTAGVCAGFCTLNPDRVGCGWDGSDDADAACLFQTRLSTGSDVATGDIMICGAVCDCNDDCGDLYCIADDTGMLDSIWGREGYCRPLAAGETGADSLACD